MTIEGALAFLLYVCGGSLTLLVVFGVGVAVAMCLEAFRE